LQMIAVLEGFALLSCSFRDTSMLNKFAAIVDSLLEKADSATSAPSRARSGDRVKETAYSH